MTEVEPLRLAAYYAEVERPRETIEALRNADPTDVRTHALRAQALLQLGRDGDAAQQAHRGLAIDAEHPGLLLLLAQAEASTDTVAAESTLRKALELEPVNPMLLATYVLLLIQQRRHEAAEQVLERGMRIAPGEMQRVRAIFFLRAPAYGRALDVTPALLREDPDDAYAHYLHGLALLTAAQPWRALRHLREAAALRPDDPLLAATARVNARWYLWPVYLTGGAVHYVLAVLCAIAAFIAAGGFDGFFKFYSVWLAFVAYKWVAAGVASLQVQRMAAAATRDDGE